MPHTKAEVFRRIADSGARSCPFVNLPNSSSSGHWGEGITEADMAKLKWVKPMVVVEVAFVEWTRDTAFCDTRSSSESVRTREPGT
jgi:hypothetical protein